MPAERAAHWEQVYAARSDTALTWHQDAPRPSLDIIAAHVGPGAAVIDVGGGTSRLVDALRAQGLGPVTVLDLSAAALATSQNRLGAHARDVTWITADITAWAPPGQYALWHDRAVLHFLTEERDRAAYLQRMDAALARDGTAVLSTFADDGPERCSNLPVVRYTPETLAGMLDRHLPGRFTLTEGRRHTHVTPKGNTQNFQTAVFRRRSA
ncbi:MAG: class I SAM-dependent methyltransferase [Rhodobacteraceae bacterium]|nr:class I SAM-dependent methyltransferase [Paracoccaceae bacterium]